MKFANDGFSLPQDNGSSDKQDSVRLAGILAIFGHPAAPEMAKYIVHPMIAIPLRNTEPDDVPGVMIFDQTTIVRHPGEYKFDCSRDQVVCAFAGLKAQSRPDLVNMDYVNGRDIFMPGVRGHIRRCQGKQAYFYQDWYLRGEVIWHAKVTPKDEPNQLLCMLMLADQKYLKLWCALNKDWRESILEYWAYSYRNEKDLANWMIAVIEERIAQ